MSSASIPWGLPRGMCEINVIPWGKGAARSGKKEFSQFLHVSLGSLSELETQLLIAEGLGYMQGEDAILQQVETVRRLLLGLIRHVKKEAA